MLTDSVRRSPCGSVWKWASISMFCLAATIVGTQAYAEPWLEVGDRTLRSDIEILAARGLIDNAITTWPLPAGEFERLSDSQLLQDQPEYVQLAARRVLERLLGDGQPRGLSPEADLSLTNHPDTIRDFGTLARDKAGGGVGLVWDSDHISAGLRVNSQPRVDDHDSQLALDGSYLSALVGNWQLYGGMVDQWYGPGWTSSLILSNNARPVPKIGIMRNNPHAFETPWLSWLGAWQFNTFVGVENGPRTDTNTILAGVRGTINPLHNLELGVTRLSQLCGANHPCNPITGEFHVQNTDANPSPVSDQGEVDAKYTFLVGGMSVSPYAQIVNRDNGPFTHANATYLIGSSIAGPFGHDGARWRVTAEYADSIATLNWFGFNKLNYGAADNDYKYIDGKRYRGRTLGFSLDSDSRLFSLAGLLTDTRGWTYRLVYYRANINSEQLAGVLPTNYPDQLYNPLTSTNSVSAKPVQFDQVEAGLVVPWRLLTFDFSVRAQDAQVYPEPGGKIAAELGISYRF